MADYQLGKEVGRMPLEDVDYALLEELVGEYASHFDRDARAILARSYTKLVPLFLRPYGRLYAY